MTKTFDFQAVQIFKGNVLKFHMSITFDGDYVNEYLGFSPMNLLND